MKFSDFLYRNKINRIESIANEIYDLLIMVDARRAASNGQVEQSGSIYKLKQYLDELWNCYWDISLIADTMKIRYKGFGGAAPVTKVLVHLIFMWGVIIQNNMEQDILSINWKNFYLNNKNLLDK